LFHQCLPSFKQADDGLTCAGETIVPGERLAAGRARLHPAEAAGQRADRRPAGGGQEAPGVHELHQEV